MSNWNPRYVLWAKKHGLTPEAMIEKDKQDWPGGCMCGFSLWIGERMRALCTFHGVRDTRELPSLLKQDYHKILDNWLEASIL
jgi:hypothetical protein